MLSSLAWADCDDELIKPSMLSLNDEMWQDGITPIRPVISQACLNVTHTIKLTTNIPKLVFLTATFVNVEIENIKQMSSALSG